MTSPNQATKKELLLDHLGFPSTQNVNPVNMFILHRLNFGIYSL